MRHAVLQALEERSAMQRGGWVAPRSASTPFAEVAAQWIDSNPSKRPSTLARDNVTLRLHILPALGSRPIGQITPSEVQTLVKRWLAERKPWSVARDYRTLAAIFHFAVDRDYIVRSPCRRIRPPKGAHRDVHVVDADELARPVPGDLLVAPLARARSGDPRLCRPIGLYRPSSRLAGDVAGERAPWRLAQRRSR